MNLAAWEAVAHSPFAGGLSHVLDVGAIWTIWASVIASSRTKRENGIGEAVERRARARNSVMYRVVCHMVS